MNITLNRTLIKYAHAYARDRFDYAFGSMTYRECLAEGMKMAHMVRKAFESVRCDYALISDCKRYMDNNAEHFEIQHHLDTKMDLPYHRLACRQLTVYDEAVAGVVACSQIVTRYYEIVNGGQLSVTDFKYYADKMRQYSKEMLAYESRMLFNGGLIAVRAA